MTHRESHKKLKEKLGQTTRHLNELLELQKEVEVLHEKRLDLITLIESEAGDDVVGKELGEFLVMFDIVKSKARRIDKPTYDGLVELESNDVTIKTVREWRKKATEARTYLKRTIKITSNMLVREHMETFHGHMKGSKCDHCSKTAHIFQDDKAYCKKHAREMGIVVHGKI